MKKSIVLVEVEYTQYEVHEVRTMSKVLAVCEDFYDAAEFTAQYVSKDAKRPQENIVSKAYQARSYEYTPLRADEARISFKKLPIWRKEEEEG